MSSSRAISHITAFNRPMRPCASRSLPSIRWLSTNDYHRYADETLETLTNELEEIVENHPDGYDFDVSFANGVLNVDLGHRGTFVINKQTPNKQIWLSSPISGPKRYDFDEVIFDWYYSHDKVTLHTRLSDELTELLGVPVELMHPSKDWFD
eukprot:TRINITY_DN5793_c0_g1_i1.p1 TRINITY_DN5793_c0_g1~~TRINITY_DN5793_c0_g1_i1.p1  ORF type:complete len:174 (+),score=22.47 TRINITY_DN5793_c0_g1_i1:69-524(+)